MEKQNTQEKTVFKWPPLESDPEIFTNYCVKVGLPKSYIFEELIGLDEELLMTVSQPILSVIVNLQRGETKVVTDDNKRLKYTDVPFYMDQSSELDNACGLIAALHSIGSNLNEINLDGNSILGKFFDQAKDKEPRDKATLLENMKEFKEAHLEYSSQGQSKLCEKQEEVTNHFVAFVYQNQMVLELDGTVGSPLIIKSNVKEDEFIFVVAEEIRRRLDTKQITENLSMMYLTK
jgi:ubiquitin carboxyl-terminal hydrolase L3